MENLYLGTCSWKYDSWRGLVYTDKKSINYLEEYSRKYKTVEIDQWFWSLFAVDKVALPSPFTVEEYSQSVPDDFKFSIKIPNSITLTHFYRKSKDEPLIVNPHFLSVKLFEQFLDTLEPLKKYLGPLMFQFEYLNKNKMSSQTEFQAKVGSFFEQLPGDFQYLIEIRNPNYLNENYFNFLNSNNVGHVFLEGYYMPPVTGIYGKFASFIKNITVIRLHGPDRSDIERQSKGNWNRILEPKKNDLTVIAEMIRDLLEKKREVYVNINNHYEGSAPLSIKRLEKILVNIIDE